MGVQGLWELLAPVGRRVSVEILGGKVLAVDASIWIIQFMKAMRDEKGDMVKNAHLLGFFRRICKLLYLRVKPVFVFDGATPALKRRTVIARRRQRERANAKIRKTAEKLLLNHLRTRKLEEIAQNIGLSQQDNQTTKALDPNNMVHVEGSPDFAQFNDSHEATTNFLSRETKPNSSMQENMMDGVNTSDSRLTAPPAVDAEVFNDAVETSDGSSFALNESDDDDDDENVEHIILPASQGRVDPAVLASLPPSMQLNLLVQMREQQVAENRKKFQKVAKDPANFSQLQIQTYLKTVAFRRDIDEVQKAAAGKGIDGIPSARIASEVDREYIFTTSYQAGKHNKDLPKETDSYHMVASEKMYKGKTITIDFDHQEPPGGDMSLTEQPSSNEIDQGDLLTGDKNMETTVTCDSDECEIEWEDGALAFGEDMEVDRSRQAVTNGGGSDIKWKDRNEVLFPQVGETPLGTDDAMMGGTLMQIEEAEIEEAIRRSLEDFRGRKLVIREGLDQINESLSTCRNLLDPSNSSDALVDFKGERKGKAVVGVSQTSSPPRMRDPIMQEGIVETSAVNSHLENSAALESLIKELGIQHPATKCINDETAVQDQVQVDSVILHANRERVAQDMDLVQTINSIGKIDGTFESKNTEEDSEKKIADERTSSYYYHDELQQKVKKILSENHIQEACVQQGNGEHATVQDIGMKKQPASQDGASDVENELEVSEEGFQNALLKEAKELDLCRERESLAEQEQGLLREREELQAEMEAEKEAMQANLQDEIDILLQEEMELRSAQRKNARDAGSVTGEMFSECQELLQMFGLPYVIAPMEAEAQCAFMNSIGIVDGVVTDDCDAFLFGGQNVFKNIFDDRKYVETYYMKDVESDLGLDRDKLIHMALLLGSDYTEGISGIGIVNAIEVVNAFQGEFGLQKFKEWIDAPDFTLLEKVHPDTSKKQTRKKPQHEASNGGVVEVVEGEGEVVNEFTTLAGYTEQQQRFIDKHRAVSKNWSIPDSFPSPLVINAYKLPQVDKSTESFSWGRPDLAALRSLCLERFGWNKAKTDELILPVLKEYDRHETQLRLDAFYTFNQRFAKIRSKRIQKAVTHITGQRSSELMDIPLESNLSENTDARNKPPEGDIKKGSKRKISKDTLHVKKTDLDVIQKRSKAKGKQGGRGRSRAQLSTLSRSSAKGNTKVSSSDTSIEEVDLRTSPVNDGQVRRSTRLSKKKVPYFGEEQSQLGASEGSSEAESHIEKSLASSNKKLHEVAHSEERSSPALGGGFEQVEDRVLGGGFCTDEGENTVQAGGFANISQQGSLAYGGEFCTDEQFQDGVGLGTDNQQGEEQILSSLYGGGFCIDEQDQQLQGVGFGNSDQPNEQNTLKGIGYGSGVHTNWQVHEDDSFNISTMESGAGVGLNAVPSMRRKRHCKPK